MRMLCSRASWCHLKMPSTVWKTCHTWLLLPPIRALGLLRDLRTGYRPRYGTYQCENRVSQAEGKLPQEVTKIGVTVEKRQNSTLRILSLYSPTDKFDRDFITNYFKINIEPKLLRIKGIGSVQLMGSEYAMRIWLDPQKMAQYGLEPSDVVPGIKCPEHRGCNGDAGRRLRKTLSNTHWNTKAVCKQHRVWQHRH